MPIAEKEKQFIMLQVAATQFPRQATWVVPLLYDAVYLYIILVSKMIADGLDFRNGTLMLQKSRQYNINYTG